MVDLVPFAGGRRIMHHGDRQLFLMGQVLELFLPQPISHPIGVASISGDQQFLLVRIERFATLLPPPSDTLDGKLGGLMVDADIDKAALLDQVSRPQ